MNLFTIAAKSIRQRLLASSLTALSVALGVMLMVAVLVIFGIVERTFSQRSIPYHLIVGPKGSDLQLVLSSVYRIAPPIENVPYHYFRQLQQDSRVKHAVPLAFGDVTEQGAFPIVGTTPEYFAIGYAPERPFRIRGAQIGDSFDAVIGSQVARINGWDLGSQFSIKHGGAQSDHIHDEKFTVVAVIEQTGTPNDKTVFLDIEGFYAIDGHDKPIDEAEKRLSDFYASDPERLAAVQLELDTLKQQIAEEASHAESAHEHQHSHATPDVLKEVTAIMLVMRSDFDAIEFTSELQKGYQAMAVNPIRPMQKLMTAVLGNIRKVLMVLTALIIAVSGVGIFVSIYNSMSDRKRDIAIMRALGARRSTVFSIILAESVLLCLIGGLLGLLLGHGIVYVAAPYVAAETGLLIDPTAFEPVELVLFPVLLVLASLIGFIPGMTAYRTDVAEALSS